MHKLRFTQTTNKYNVFFIFGKCGRKAQKMAARSVWTGLRRGPIVQVKMSRQHMHCLLFNIEILQVALGIWYSGTGVSHRWLYKKMKSNAAVRIRTVALRPVVKEQGPLRVKMVTCFQSNRKRGMKNWELFRNSLPNRCRQTMQRSGENSRMSQLSIVLRWRKRTAATIFSWCNESVAYLNLLHKWIMPLTHDQRLEGHPTKWEAMTY